MEKIDLSKYLTKEDLEQIEKEEEIWCDCGYEGDNTIYKEEGVEHLGVTKHGWLCPKCHKYVQIG